MYRKEGDKIENQIPVEVTSFSHVLLRHSVPSSNFRNFVHEITLEHSAIWQSQECHGVDELMKHCMFVSRSTA